MILANVSPPGWETKEDKSNLFQSVWHTDVGSAVLHPPTLTRLPSGTPLQQFTRIIQVNNSDPGFAPLTCALHNRQMAAAPRPPPRFVWLRFILGKVASANMREQPLQPLIPTWSSLDHVCLTFPGSHSSPIRRLQWRHTFPATQTHVWLTSSFNRVLFLFFLTQMFVCVWRVSLPTNKLLH